MPALIASLTAPVAPAIAGFWRWWTGELAALMPAGPRIATARRASADILPDRAQVELVRVAKGEGERLVERKPLADFDAENWAELEVLTSGYRTRVVLKPPMIHVLTLDLPKAARARLRFAIPLQLRVHAPVLPEYLDWAILEVRPDGERLRAQVAITRTTTLDDIARGFRDRGLPVPAIMAECDGMAPVRLRPAAGRGGAGFNLPWTIAMALLLSAPLWMLLALHLLAQREETRVEALSQIASPRLATERRLAEAAKTGEALKALLAIPSVTDAIEDLARRLPTKAHAVEVTGQDDHGLAFTVEAADPDTIRPALTGDDALPHLREVSQTQTSVGALRIHYETGPR